MFTAEIVRDRIRQQPFGPLRLVNSAGQKFDMKHPDMVLVGRNFVTIGYPESADPTIIDREVRVAVLHVTSIENLPVKRRLGEMERNDRRSN